MAPEAFFRNTANGQRLYLYSPPQQLPARGAVLYVPPFAEEMNKSRRMAALQARALAAQGYAVLQIDLFGCGDSAGDFANATWDAWLDDVGEAMRWLDERCPGPRWLWGLRSGCLLAAEVARRGTGDTHCLFWQPVIAGKQLLQQFLRLQLASELLAEPGSAARSSAKATLAAGQAVEIAGYRLSPALASGLENADLQPPAGPGRLIWLEVTSRPDASLSPAATRPLAAWADAGHAVTRLAVNGPAFWQSVEIETAPALLHATQNALAAASP